MYKTEWDQIATSIGYKDEKEMFEDLYIRCGMSIKDIADRTGFSTTAVRRHIKMHNIQTRKQGGPRSVAVQQWRLFHTDQRFVLGQPMDVVAKYLGCSKYTLYNYRRRVGKYVVLPTVEKTFAVGGGI